WILRSSSCKDRVYGGRFFSSRCGFTAFSGWLRLRPGPPGPRFLFENPFLPPPGRRSKASRWRGTARRGAGFLSGSLPTRGLLLCVERWGGDDGPDDAIENCTGWPVLHAMGADDEVLHMYKKAWEGHLRQYTLAKTVEVPFARDGMYYKEFPVMFDWLHNGEG